MKQIISLFLIISCFNFKTISAQIAINTDNSDPDASAMLDIKSTDKGLLIPRMTTTQRTTVSNPAMGLLVFDNTTSSFWFYSGSAWVELNSGTIASLHDADSDTKIQVEESADEDSIRIDIAGIERMVIRQNMTGLTLVNFPNNHFNTFLGHDAGQATSPGTGGVDPTGTRNSFLGYQAGLSNTSGHSNVFIGFHTGRSNTSGHSNVFNGLGAGQFNTVGEKNVFTGYLAGFFNTTGRENVISGYQAGLLNTMGNGNVFIGHHAGYNETNSDKLYIENSDTSTPLIYGEFDNDIVKIHGTLGIKDEYTFPITKGMAGQVLQSDGAGNTTWTTPSANTDNQKTDVFQLNGNHLELSLENDGEATKTVDLSSFTNTDNQKVDVFQLNGNHLELSLENDGEATHSIDLSSINSTETLIADADNDTKIQVEKGTDEDKIRIDLGGSERIVIEQNPQGGTILSLPNNNQNTFLGEGAGIVTNSSGTSNSFIGYQAGYSNTNGLGNVFNGYQAGYSNIGSAGNVFSGYNAGYSNISGNDNVFIGNRAGYSNNTGYSNAFIGYLVGYSNTSGYQNVFNGPEAGYSNTTGYRNVFTGYRAGINNTTGFGNTFTGNEAGFRNIIGNGNVFLGTRAGYYETGSNKLYIDNSDSSTPLIHGDFSADALTIHGTLTSEEEFYPKGRIFFPNSVAPTPNVTPIFLNVAAGNLLSFGHAGVSEDYMAYYINDFYFRDSPGGADNSPPSLYAAHYNTYSSRRWKHNIEDMEDALSIIQQLRGVTYTWNEDRGGKDDFGFIAEEVHQVLPQIAPKKDGKVEGVAYGKLTPYLVEAIKEQQTTIKTQNQKIQQLEQQVEKINELENQLKQIQAKLANSLKQ